MHTSYEHQVPIKKRAAVIKGPTLKETQSVHRLTDGLTCKMYVQLCTENGGRRVSAA